MKRRDFISALGLMALAPSVAFSVEAYWAKNVVSRKPDGLHMFIIIGKDLDPDVICVPDSEIEQWSHPNCRYIGTATVDSSIA